MTYHFNLSHLASDQVFTFHKRGKVYPIRSHTPETKATMCASHPRLATIPPEKITHFVEGVATSPNDGVVIQAVRTPVKVDGPNGPNTQTYYQLVSYAISIPGIDNPYNDTADLAYALLFMHNNLMNLSSTDSFTIPQFVFQNCIQPNAGDLEQAIIQLQLSGQSWISDPYPVMLSPTQHLVYPENPAAGLAANSVVFRDTSDNATIDGLLKPKHAEAPTYKTGDWVYSQRMNADALQPALSSCIAAALRVAKNAPQLEGSTWSVQNAVLSSTYNATQISTAPKGTIELAAALPQDSGNVQWTVTDLSPGSGLTVDTSSLVVDMSKDTDNPNYAGQLQLQCTNHWLRHLSAYVEFLKYQGEGSSRVLVPIDLGSSNTQIPNPNPDPNQPPYINVNTTWPGDFVDQSNYLWQGMGFIEPSTTEKFLSWVNPTGTICGIPVPAAPTTLTVDYIPKDANVVRIKWGGLGRGPYDQDVCAVGISLTAVFELALPTILLMYDAATVDSAALTESVWNHKGTMLNLLQTIVSVVMNTKLDAATMAQQDAEAIGKFLAESLLPDLLQTGCAYGVILMAQITMGAAMEAIPFVDIASLIFNGAITVAQLTQTIVEVLESPFVFTTDIARTFDLTLNIDPDADMHEFPPEAIGGTYRVSIAFSNNSTPAVFEYEMPATTWSTPIPILFSSLPAGGQIQVSVFMYSQTGWQAGQGQSAWVDAKGDGSTTMKTLNVTVTNNAPPLDQFTVYQFVEKTVYANGGRQWLGTKSLPPATQPTATQGTDTNITELNGITICQDAGMLGYTYQTNSSQFTVQNISLLQNPQSAYAAASGIVVMPALAYQRKCAPDGSGLNFYLDANPATNDGEEAHLRRLSLIWTQQGGSQPPNFNPDPSESWGRFPFPMDRLAAFNNYVAGISYDAVNHSKIFVLRVPDAGMPNDQSPKACMISGPGTRIGLISLPRAITFGILGQILVLEEGTSRVQAFDVNGNPYPCFDPQDTGTKTAVMPLANVTTGTVLLDIAVEPKGYIYVLSYEGLGASPSDYHLDLYKPNGAFLARTDNFAAANIAVDIIRDVYTLNYEALENSPTLEPSVSLWIPPVKSYAGTIYSIQAPALVMQQTTSLLNITTDAQTIISINGQSGTFAQLAKGQTITAYGSMNSQGTLYATQLFATTTSTN